MQNDWTLRFENRWFQLAEKHQKLALAGREVTVSRRLDGELELLYGGRELCYQELPAAPQRPQKAAEAAIRSNQGQRPAADHPWRHGPVSPAVGAAGWGRRRSGSLRSPPQRRPHPELF